VYWIKLAEDMLKFWSVMKKLIPSGFVEEQNFLNSWATVSFWRRALCNWL